LIDSLYCSEYLKQIISISKPNKYTNWYISLCAKAAIRSRDKKEARHILGYIESHHILPKSFKMGGDKDADNLVHFTAREHFVSHILLTKMVDGDYYHKMLHAAMRLSNRAKLSRLYSKTRIDYCEYLKLKFKGKPSPMTPKKIAANESRRGKTTSRKGKPPTENELAQHASMRGKKIILTQKQIDAYKSRKGKPLTEKQILAYANRKGKPIAKTRIDKGKKTSNKQLKEPREIDSCIDIEQTISKFGYDPRYLSKGSNRKVVKKFSCCGKFADRPFQVAYKPNCNDCLNKEKMKNLCKRLGLGKGSRIANGYRPTEELRKLRSEQSKIRFSTPEARKNLSDKAKLYWSKPEVKEVQSKNAKLQWARKREEKKSQQEADIACGGVG
jgi:hypothetical protein